MIRNYIKIALRNLWKFKGYTLINILGLAIGMACVILIMLYVKSETSYDKFHQHRDHTYQLNIRTTNPQTGESNARAIGPYRLAEEMRIDFSDMEEIVRFVPQGREMVEYGDQRYMEENLTFVDDNVFNVFDFRLTQGDPATALTDPYSLVVTQEIADKYFGTGDPMGKVVQIRERDYSITGILEEIPQNSQFDFNILVSINAADQIFSRIVLENWGEGSSWTFVRVPVGQNADDYRSRLSAFVDKNLEAWKRFSPEIEMMPLPKLYLHSQDISSFASGGDITYVYAFSFIALFILIIACINFMNLATARSSLRAREVGLRKVVGAERSQLIGQFLSESTALALISLVLAVVLARLALPFFNQLADRDISLSLVGDPGLILGLIAITLFVGVVAGSYPALLISGFKPVNVLSGKIQQGLQGGSLRKVLVSFQFATSIFLLIVTGIVYQQLQYCKNLDLGFDRENLVLFGAPLEMRGQFDQFRSELLSNPRIVNAAASSRVPPGRLSSSLRARPEGVPEDQQKGMQTVWTDYDFIETMGFDMLTGRSFSRDFPADATTGFILNEAAVQDIGWTPEEALNKTFGSSEIADWTAGQWQPRDGKVIGVLKDFHFETLKQEIRPTVYFIAPYMAWNYVVRISPQQVPETIRFIEDKWSQFNPEVPFEYTFVDDNFADLYANEERQGKIFGVFALLGIFIACLGLVGLASFTAERKKKEVGIRKVLGASSFNLVVLLSKEFTWLVIIAFVVATPLAWMIMRRWLEDFAYQVPVGAAVFLLSGAVALLIAWITVGYQTGKAALRNPVNAIRYE